MCSGPGASRLDKDGILFLRFDLCKLRYYINVTGARAEVQYPRRQRNDFVANLLEYELSRFTARPMIAYAEGRWIHIS